MQVTQLYPCNICSKVFVRVCVCVRMWCVCVCLGKGEVHVTLQFLVILVQMNFNFTLKLKGVEGEGVKLPKTPTCYENKVKNSRGYLSLQSPPLDLPLQLYHYLFCYVSYACLVM